MIQASNYPSRDRRILSSPAVHPCEEISLQTLLSSLISLSHTIISTYQSRFFPSHKTIARETFRQVQILLIFFQHIHHRPLPPSSYSLRLCFSDLHLTLQRLHFLLQDCSRQGARLWILIKTEFVTTQFRVMIRAISTALEILNSIQISDDDEVKELIQLLGKQSRKVKIEVHPDDETAAKQIRSILNQFERKSEPEIQRVKIEVLDYLHIKSWNLCNKEITFLEQEIEFLSEEKRDVNILSSLLGFMNYCRGVVFDAAMDCPKLNPIIPTDDNNRSNNLLDCLNPEDFRCPISLDLMIDPVTVSTGHTYDRSSIEKWLKSGNTTCPKTGEKLFNSDLIPNTSLRKLIHQFCSDNGIPIPPGKKTRDITGTTLPGSPAAAEAMKFLSEHLTRRLIFGNHDQKNKAAYEIRLLAKANIFNRYCVIQAGAVLPLLNLLHSSDKSTQENAIAALLKLSKYPIGKKQIVENGGLGLILRVLNQGLTLDARQIAAAIIFYLSSVKGYRKLIGETAGAVTGLVDLIREGTACGKKKAVVALFGLILYHGNHSRVLQAGTVSSLVNVLSNFSDKPELVADSLAVLSALAENVKGALTILETPLALNLISKILIQSGSARASKEYCVSIMVSLCGHGGQDVISLLAREPSLVSSLYSLITEGTTHASKKASSLIKTIQETRLVVQHQEFGIRFLDY